MSVVGAGGASRMGVNMASTKTDGFSVSGMTCGSCAQRVENALLQREDVTEASVDLMGAKVRVTHDAGTDLSVLFDAVRALGYEAGPLL